MLNCEINNFADLAAIFDPVDLALASKNDTFSWAIAYLSLAARQGHICVIQKNNSLQPSLEDLGLASSKGWMEKFIAGFEQLKDQPHPYAEEHEGRWYLPRFFAIEKGIIKGLENLQDNVPDLKIDTASLREDVQTFIDQKKLHSLQGEAILLAAESSCVLLTGGPGTGKTYTIRRMIDLLSKHLQSNHNMKVVLTAPTGKAAANLGSVLTADINNNISVSTLHRLLRIVPGRAYRQVFIDADLVIVDECSMIDAQMFFYLLSSIKPGARIILVGDPYQLPSVEAGAIFNDIVNSKFSFPRIHLTECQRAELTTLVKWAEAVKRGDCDELISLSGQPGIEWHLLPAKITRKVQEEIINLLEHPVFNEDSSPKDILDHFKRKVLLTPLREGPLGVETLNRLCLERYGSRSAPILITRNDDKNGLSNGDVGVLVKHGGDLRRGDFAYFTDPQHPEGIRKIPALLLPKYEYAYALSVHKSQGSEYPHVILLLPKGSESFGRQVLYTAITRARRSISLWCENEILFETLAHCPDRVSGL